MFSHHVVIDTLNRPVILIDPDTFQHDVFLSHTAPWLGSGVLYGAVPGEVASIRDWLRSLLWQYAEVLPDFGEILLPALEIYDPDAWGIALADELEKCGQDVDSLFFFVDPLDILPQDAVFSRFMVALVDSLPRDVSLVLSTTRTSYEPWITLLERDRISHLPGSLQVEASTPQIEVTALGKSSIVVDGESIGTDDVMQRLMLHFLVDHPLLRSDDLVRWFRPHTAQMPGWFSVQEQTALSRLKFGLLPTENQSCLFMLKQHLVISYDVEAFELLFTRAEQTIDQEEKRDGFQQAVDIYRGDFLAGYNAEWVLERRKGLKKLYARALIRLGEYCIKDGDREQAIHLFARAVEQIPADEYFHRELLMAYFRARRFQDAHAFFVVLEGQNRSLSEDTRELYRLISSMNK